jgi:hypothetical protein
VSEMGINSCTLKSEEKPSGWEKSRKTKYSNWCFEHMSVRESKLSAFNQEGQFISVEDVTYPSRVPIGMATKTTYRNLSSVQFKDCTG